MAKSGNNLVISNISGGMENTLGQHEIPDNRCRLAENVEFFLSSLGERRLGCDPIDMTGSGLEALEVIVHLGTHLPVLAELVDTELFAVGANLDISVALAHRDDNLAWSAVAMTDPANPETPNVLRMRSASIHGKWFFAYDSDVDRLHVFDNGVLRRVGIAQPDSPTVVDSGGTGTLTGDRIYRIRFIKQTGSDKVLRSEPSAEFSVTPSGTADGITICYTGTPDAWATHWEIEGSSGDGNFYVLATLPLATPCYTDTTADPLDFSDGVLSEDPGDYVPVPSVKYLIADQDRLVFGGSWEDPEKDSRISWTPVWAAPGVGNDERIPVDTDNFIDLDWQVGGGLTGLSEPVNGSFYAFKHNRIYKVQRTGRVDNAYEAFLLSASRGAIIGSVVSGSDEQGRGCVYFLDPQGGPARIGSGGLQFMSGLRETWLTVNTAADMVASHGIYYTDKQQVHWWVASGDHHSPNLKIISQTDEVVSDGEGTSGGWIIATGTLAEAWCSTVIPELMSDPDTGSAILTFRPYAGFRTPFQVSRCDITNEDNGVPYRAIILTKPYILAGLLNQWGGMDSALLADAIDNPQVTIDIRMIRDWGLDETKVTTSFVPQKSETLVIKRFDQSKMSESSAIQFEFSDPPIISGDC